MHALGLEAEGLCFKIIYFTCPRRDSAFSSGSLCSFWWSMVSEVTIWVLAHYYHGPAPRFPQWTFRENREIVPNSGAKPNQSKSH